MIKYYGGKKWLADKLKDYLPNDNCLGFVDLFVGGGSISDVLNCNFKNSVINDIDKNLINFYYTLKNDYGTLLELVLDGREKVTFEDVKKFRFELESETDDYVRAFKYYTCVYCGYGGKPYASPTRDKFNQYKKRDVIKDFNLCKNTLSNVRFENILCEDYHNVQYKGYLYYCDPPYCKVGATEYYGKNGKNHKNFDHIEFYRYIREIAKHNKVIISYENSDFIRDLYKDFYIVPIDKKKTVNYNPHSKLNETINTPEILIFNYNPEEGLDVEKEEVKLTVYTTEKMFDVSALAEKEPELFEELVRDYPVEKGTYQYNVG